MKHLLIFLALTACATAQPTMPFAMWKSAAVSSTFTPKSIDSLLLWVASDSIAAKSAGDTLHYWRDLSGKGHHLWQLTATRKPVYRTDSLNGKPCVVFDGSDDIMSTITNLGIASDDVTIAVVLTRSKPIDLSIIAELSTNAFGVGYSFFLLSGDQFGSNDSAHVEFLVSGEATKSVRAQTITNMVIGPHIYVADALHGAVATAVPRIFTDGAANHVIGHFYAYTQQTFRSAPLFIGARSGPTLAYKGSFYEIAVYSRRLTDSERAQLTQYYQTKYGL